jgi:hypothetical protein
MSGAPGDKAEFGRRAGRHLWLGAIAGTVAGALVGLVIGSIAFESARAIWGSVAAGAIFIGGVSTFIAGISSLEPPRPGRELSSGSTDPVSKPEQASTDADPDAEPLVVEEPIERPDGASPEQGEGRSR